MGDSLLNQLKSVINEIDGCPSPPCCSPCCPSPPKPGCPPCPFAYPQVCMLTPPCCPAPTEPKYVKPLALPTPPCPKPEKERDLELEYQLRIANFYNNYNVDYHTQSSDPCKRKKSSGNKCCGVAVDGQLPKCDDYSKQQKDEEECKNPGCPTGYKPCMMKLCSPPKCDPLGIWQATIQPCPPKFKKSVSKYVPGECKRPCCKHWKSKDGPCLYDKPCKAHCYDHPPGIKPSHQC